MNDDYLWKRSGAPDPEVERLERALRPLAHDGHELELPAASETPVRRRAALIESWPRLARREWLAAAAVLLVAAGVFSWARFSAGRPGWDVTRLDGAPRIGRSELKATGRLAAGAWLETDGHSRARMDVGTIGELTLEPNSRLRLVSLAPGRHKVALARGTLHAFIVAPPRSFTVETPSASATDLGCAYTLEVADDGGAVVTVTSGWVSFDWRGREVFIPAGARCETRPGRGPGVPYRIDAPGLRGALTTLADPAATAPARAAALAAVLRAAKRDDALTLWHLLARLSGAERETVLDRLVQLVPPPAGVTRDGVLAGDRAMLDRWWDALGLGDVEWWRMWQGRWPSAT